MGSGRQPTSNTTPASPSAIPASFDSGNGSLSHSAAARAPKNGLLALRMAAVEAAMCWPAKQNSANGSAELTMPKTRKSRQRSRNAGIFPRDSASMIKTTNASATRLSASQSGPTTGTATRMKAKEPPQSAASATRRARSAGDISSRGGSRLRGHQGEVAASARKRAFMLQEPCLAPQSTAIPGQCSVGADHAMARHDKCELVVAVGTPDRTHRRRPPDFCGDVGVGKRLPGRNRAQRLPKRTLKRRASELQRSRERQRAPGKIRVELLANMVEMEVLTRNDALRKAAAQSLHFALQAAAVDELEQVQPGVVGQGEHRTERCLEPFGV